MTVMDFVGWGVLLLWGLGAAIAVLFGVWGDLAVRQVRRDLDAWGRELDRRSRYGFIYDDDDDDDNNR